jgi:hypothetical protein
MTEGTHSPVLRVAAVPSEVQSPMTLPTMLFPAILPGTLSELLQVLKTTANGPDFIAVDTLRAVVLDEVDVLLPLAPKTFRTNLDNTKNKEDGLFLLISWSFDRS